MTQVGTGVGSGIVRGIATWGDKIVIVGSFSEGGGKRFVMTWDGSAFAALGNGVTSANVGDTVYTVAVTPAGDIIIGGQFDEVDGVACFGTARYDADLAAWVPYYDIDSGGTLGICYRLYLDGSNVYILGNYDNIEGVAINSLSKNGAVVATATGPGGTGECSEGIFFNGQFYVGGNFSTIDADSALNICYLGGGNYGNTYWNYMGDPVISTDGLSGPLSNRGGPALAVYQGSLYVTGGFADAGGVIGVDGLVRWSGPNTENTTDSKFGWHRVADLTAGGVASGTALYPYGGYLFCLGAFTTPASYAARYDGTDFDSVAGFNGPVYCAGELIEN